MLLVNSPKSMAAVELDPLFVKALKLMHSRRPNALEELKQMTDEAIAFRRGELALKKLENEGKSADSKTGIKREHSDTDKRVDNAKQSLEKLKEDLAFLTDEPVPTKKQKLESSTETKPSIWKDKDSKERERTRETSRESSHREKKIIEEKDLHKPTMKEDPSWLDIGQEAKNKKPPDVTEKRFIIGGTKADGDSSDEDNDAANFPGLDAEQFATDMMDLACVVCKRLDMTSGNRLLDCQECGRIYHQECHKPPVNEDVDDPRFVWYCSKCSKNMKKLVKAQKPKSNQNSGAKDKETVSAPVKAFRPEASIQTPFKRIDTSKSVVSTKESNSRSTSSTSHPYTGLASLAANLSNKTHSTSSSGVSWSKTSKPVRTEPTSKAVTSTHASKTDSSKGLGFLFKPDAHKITNLSTQKSSSSGEKSGLYKISSSGKASSSGKSSTSAVKASAAGTSALTKTTTPSTVVAKSGSSGTSLSRGNSTGSAGGNSGGSKGMQSSSIMSADKKVQLMKKKAAARAAEKKTLR